MWVLKHFEVNDRELTKSFVREHGFGTLVSIGTKFPEATHIPMEWEENAEGHAYLRGHLAKANPQWKDFGKNPNVLVIFLSPVEHYISSSWYEMPNAPTWNYMSVHVEGKVKLIEGEALWASVSRLTDHYEKHSKHPVSLDGLPPEVQNQIQGIVGFEIAIEKVHARFKMSQNRKDSDYQNIIIELNALNTTEARLMADALSSMKT